MRVELEYGASRVALDLAGDWDILSEPAGEPLHDPGAAFDEALGAPAAGPPLADLARAARAAAVSVPDLTRPFPVAFYLPRLLAVLNAAGIADRDVTAFVATGLHRPLSSVEIRGLLGSCADRIRAENHDPEEGLLSLGATSRGVPVHVNRKACECGLAVSMGSIGFHFHAGFSGGPKGVVPGLAGAETIRRNHLLALSGPGDRWHPGCGPGRLAGNPVAEDILEASERFPGAVFVANLVPAPRGGPMAVAAGRVREAHRFGCELYAARFSRRVERAYDAVVVSAGGHPRDVNLIQAHKAAAHASGALKEGGTLVLVAECPEGTGHPDLQFWFGKPLESLKSLSAETGRKYVQTGYAFQDEARRFRFGVLGGMDAGLLAKAGIAGLRTPEEAESFLKDSWKPSDRGLVVRDPSMLCLPPGEART